MKLKRILALLGAAAFIILSILALVLAIAGAPANYLMADLACIVLIPIFFYAGNLIARLLEQKDSGPDESSDAS